MCSTQEFSGIEMIKIWVKKDHNHTHYDIDFLQMGWKVNDQYWTCYRDQKC